LLKLQDPQPDPKASGPLEKLLRDEARFFKTWFDSPLLTGAVSPSGRKLAARMAASVPLSGSGPVVELGPGTGPVTEALLERGFAPARLVLIEFNPEFCTLLRQRFPGVQVIEGDAYGLVTTLGQAGIHKIDAVVSSLPLLTRPELERLRLLGEAFSLMPQHSPFVQFTYSLNSPVPLGEGETRIAGIEAEVSPTIWHNLPPARVWTYRSTGFVFDAAEPLDRRSLGDKICDDPHFKPAVDLWRRIGQHFDKKPPNF